MMLWDIVELVMLSDAGHAFFHVITAVCVVIIMLHIRWGGV